jgi:hypothetical protein
VPANRKEYNREWILLAISFLAINAWMHFFQAPFSYQGGRVWEHAIYYDLADQLQHHAPLSGTAPAVFRVGTPWLASIVGSANIVQSFLFVNLIANALGIFLFLYWLRFFLKDWRVRIGLLVLYQLHWLAPTRFIHFMSLYVDPWGFTTLLAGLILIEQYRRDEKVWRIIPLILLSAIGVYLRETVLLVPVALLFVRVKHTQVASVAEQVKTFFAPNNFALLVMPLIAGALGFTVLHTLATQTNEYHFATAAYNWAYAKPFLVYLHGWFIAFGFLLVPIVIEWRFCRNFLRDNLYLAFYLFALAVLAWIGGSDTERVLLWASPVVLVLLGKCIEERGVLARSFLLTGLLIALQLISERVFWMTPGLDNVGDTSPIFLTSMSGSAYYFYLFSYHAPRSVEVISLLQYVLVFLIGVSWMRMRSHDNYAISGQ